MARIRMIQTGDGTYWFFIGDSLEDSIAHLHLMIHDGKASITHFYVDPKFRRRGYGSRLLRKAESFHARRERKPLRFGFQPVTLIQKGFIKIGDLKYGGLRGDVFPEHLRGWDDG